MSDSTPEQSFVGELLEALQSPQVQDALASAMRASAARKALVNESDPVGGAGEPVL